MDVTIRGITEMDRMELEQELEAHGAKFNDDDSSQHGQGDMGIFTIVVPLTVAVAQVLNTWIKQRTPITTVEVLVTEGSTTTKVATQGGNTSDVQKLLESVRDSVK